MVKLILKSLFCFVLLLSFFGFKSQEQTITGIYGVGQSDPSAIKLTLNEDHSFHYQDFSNYNQKIDTKGIWEMKNNSVMLKNEQSDLNFHNKWKISKDGNVAKSRKGITFYSLHRIEK